MMSHMILGGQWGSEGKGLFAGFTARHYEADAVVSQFGPNAGHTWVEGDVPIVFKSLPVGSIAPSVRKVFLGPGSVINPSILRRELSELSTYLDGKIVYVHEAAAILEPEDAAAESVNVRHIASTMQGTAEAMIRKIRRSDDYPARKALTHLNVKVITHDDYRDEIHKTERLQIEGSQGMDLSINSGFRYPYVTSRDCTPSQVLADCGLHPNDLFRIYACIRTYPIRVGNVYDENNNLAGTSGPCYPDQREMSWEELGLEKEYTTVTKRVRRVFTFSMMQLHKLLREVRPDGIFLNFANYMQGDHLQELVRRINEAANGTNIVQWIGYGPKATDIKCLRGESRITPPEYGE